MTGSIFTMAVALFAAVPLTIGVVCDKLSGNK
jgi:hypothetical protein